MNRVSALALAFQHTVPHRRGDEPHVLRVVDRKRLPFPTGVGMNHSVGTAGCLVTPVPHRRGDEP